MKRVFMLYNLIIYTGILTFISLVFTFILGITGANFTLHVRGGYTTLFFALVHLALIVYKTIKIKGEICR